ncbi:formin-like protein 11 [Tanacetum coccineum]
MIQHVLKGMNDNNNGGAKPSISRQSGGGLTRSDSFKGGSHSDSYAGGEKAVDLPHVSDIFQDMSGGGLTRSDNFKGGSNGDSCAGGEKAIDLPHVSHIFLDIVSDLTKYGFFDNDEPGWKKAEEKKSIIIIKECKKGIVTSIELLKFDKEDEQVFFGSPIGEEQDHSSDDESFHSFYNSHRSSNVSIFLFSFANSCPLGRVKICHYLRKTFSMLRMNVGTIRGGAKAFKLNTLLKLSDVKGTDGKTTLLHFVVQEIVRSEGVRVSESIIGKINQKASQEALKIEKKTRNMGLELFFVESMKSFLTTAQKHLEEVEEEERKSLDLVKEITEYFQRNMSKDEVNPLRIFVIVRDFLAMLDFVCRELRRSICCGQSNPLAPFQ